MTTDRDRVLKDRLTRILDARTDGLDASTLSRLNQARHRALSRPPGLHAVRWTGLGAIAASVLAGLLWFGTLTSPHERPGDSEFAEIDLLTEDIELVEELDFYLWLELADTGTDDA